MTRPSTTLFPTALLARIEEAGLNAAGTPQQRLVDGWLLRYSAGKAKRARCVNPIAAGRLPVAEKLALCRAVYEAAGLPLMVRITPFAEPAGLDDSLAALGLPRFDDTRVMVLPELAQALPSGPAVTLEPVGPQAYAQIVGGLRGSPPGHREAHAQRLALSPVPYRGFVLRDGDGEIAVCGQYVVEGLLVGLYDVYTAPKARNHGWASRLCLELLRRAVADGARTAYLQVDADNTPARAVYHRIGFRDGYAYHYRGAAELPRPAEPRSP
ncbi:GNAT family N-acetyltransferase [Aquabacterium sp. A7-Y]|uniref:GNAT family N-acetyltransferase n=1 Tax=Aquabacterium sp. A7-Y TaxID=1349605 RepID=UPI00223E70C7|nr:GNAT family N-acetyltransferase [Aquabacterium sp. A7-Y]MCW7538381.1 GNAT family N-acetyltransferase [Aquabacterium sp. A7-Y]